MLLVGALGCGSGVELQSVDIARVPGMTTAVSVPTAGSSGNSSTAPRVGVVDEVSPDSPFCRSDFIVEGDIIEVKPVRAPSRRARIRVSHTYKGVVPDEIYYTHVAACDALDQLIEGDHVIVFGEYDAERGSLLNTDLGRRHFVRDDKRDPPIMFYRTCAPPNMEERDPPTVIVSLFPKFQTAEYLKDADVHRQIAGERGVWLLENRYDDPRAHGADWNSLTAQLEAAIRSRQDCLAPGAYLDADVRP